MNITVAGVKKEVSEGLTVAQLVIDENVEMPQYVTVTVNDGTLTNPASNVIFVLNNKHIGLVW